MLAHTRTTLPDVKLCGPSAEGYSICLPFPVSRFFLSIPLCQTQKITPVSMGYSHKNSMRGGSHLTEQLLSIPSGSAPLRLLCVCCVRGESVSALMRQPPHTPPLVTAPLFRANAKLAHASCFQFPHWLQGGGPVQRAKSRVPFCCFTAWFDTSGMSKNGNAVSECRSKHLNRHY